MEQIPQDNPFNPEEGDEWPELTAIANIIERARMYSSEEQCTVRLSVQIELTGLPAKQVKEKYVVAGAPADVDDVAAFNKRANDLKQIVTEEMDSAFPGAIEEIPTEINGDINKDAVEIIETLNELVDPPGRPQQPIINSLPNLISLHNLENIDNA